MDRRSNSNSFNKAISSNPFITDEQSEENDNVSSLTGPESPPSSSLASPRKGTKRSMQKRVVSVPIKDAEGSRLKGESAPPSDSWAWRKYGQKPIKGSPYPRGYYRCSSSKGCPARKQVERSRLDPAMLVITYSCEHNHPWPASRKQMEATETPKKSTKAVKQDSILTTEDSMEPESGMEDGFAAGLTTGDSMEPESGMEDRFAAGLTTEDSILTTADEFGWFGEMETISSTVLESPLFLDNDEADTAAFYPMREEDESLFADLGELPECSFVFRHQRNVGPQVGIC